jgi:hypothetical protein
MSISSPPRTFGGLLFLKIQQDNTSHESIEKCFPAWFRTSADCPLRTAGKKVQARLFLYSQI